MAYLLGIDGGGTGCRAAVVDPDGRIVASGESGPANIVSDFAVAVANILGAARSALGQVGINPSSDALKVGLGLAGGNAEGAVRDLGFTLPFRRMRIASDAETAAKGALGQADGILAAIGYWVCLCDPACGSDQADRRLGVHPGGRRIWRQHGATAFGPDAENGGWSTSRVGSVARAAG